MCLGKQRQSGDQPAHRDGGRGADTDDFQLLLLAIALGSVRDVIERGADFPGERPGMGRRHHALPITHKQRLTEPLLKGRNLPTDRAVSQVQFPGRSRVTACPGGHFKNAQRVKRRKFLPHV
ncbi:hypothetical protein D3C80_1775060 [compost metagenome]